MLDYRTFVEHDSLYNTPPVFAIYVVMLVTRWLRDEVGGLEEQGRRNRAKAELLYAAIEASGGFYRGHADPGSRSLMNVTFNLSCPEKENRFLAEAQAAGFSGLAGHRSTGGVRASLYNGLTLAAVEQLAGFMEDFQRRHHQ
jgi:phosphoserine aminotransferase